MAAVCDHPVAKIQDLIDRLKTLTTPIDNAETKNLKAVWNELEDLLIMVATSKISIDAESQSDTLRKIIAAIDEYKDTEKTDADSNEEPGRVDSHRGSSHSDGARDERGAGETGHRRSEGD